MLFSLIMFYSIIFFFCSVLFSPNTSHAQRRSYQVRRSAFVTSTPAAERKVCEYELATSRNLWWKKPSDNWSNQHMGDRLKERDEVLLDLDFSGMFGWDGVGVGKEILVSYWK